MDISLDSAQIAKTCDAEGTCDKLAAEAKARSQANHDWWVYAYIHENDLRSMEPVR